MAGSSMQKFDNDCDANFMLKMQWKIGSYGISVKY